MKSGVAHSAAVLAIHRASLGRDALVVRSSAAAESVDANGRDSRRPPSLPPCTCTQSFLPPSFLPCPMKSRPRTQRPDSHPRPSASGSLEVTHFNGKAVMPRAHSLYVSPRTRLRELRPYLAGECMYANSATVNPSFSRPIHVLNVSSRTLFLTYFIYPLRMI